MQLGQGGGKVSSGCQASRPGDLQVAVAECKPHGDDRISTDRVDATHLTEQGPPAVTSHDVLGDVKRRGEES